MTYTDISTIINVFKKVDQSFMLKASIVSAIDSNMDLRPYDYEGFDELCNRFYEAIMSHASSHWPDFDEVAYRAQMLIDDETYESPTIECFEQAIADCDQ